MPASGSAKNWSAEKGFGFIAADSGLPNVFCHASALLHDFSSLVVGERVLYDVEYDAQGRPRAVNVTKSDLDLDSLQNRLLRAFSDSGGIRPSGFSLPDLGRAFHPPLRQVAANPLQLNRARRRSFAATAEAGPRRICMNFAAGEACVSLGDGCSNGCHLRTDDDCQVSLTQVSIAKMRLLQQSGAMPRAPACWCKRGN